jgi:fructokinase
VAAIFGGVEAGGTKFVCAVGTGPEDLELCAIPTAAPGATTQAVIEFFRHRPEVQAVGIGSFGPVDLHPGSPTFGYITATPKLAWRHFDLAGSIRHGLGVPIGFDTDVNAAALAEARWGAAQGLDNFLYLTVGTGIGGGVLVSGQPLHGLIHPEMGHIRVPHDRTKDPYAGGCPYHGDCLEGLASGPAIQARWGTDPKDLSAGHPAWELEAEYLALGLANWVCTLSPRRIVLGGGVMEQSQLFPMVRCRLRELLNGYLQASELLDAIDSYVVPARLGPNAGVLGALVLAEAAVRTHGDVRDPRTRR